MNKTVHKLNIENDHPNNIDEKSAFTSLWHQNRLWHEICFMLNRTVTNGD